MTELLAKKRGIPCFQEKVARLKSKKYMISTFLKLQDFIKRKVCVKVRHS